MQTELKTIKFLKVESFEIRIPITRTVVDKMTGEAHVFDDYVTTIINGDSAIIENDWEQVYFGFNLHDLFPASDQDYGGDVKYALSKEACVDYFNRGGLTYVNFVPGWSSTIDSRRKDMIKNQRKVVRNSIIEEQSNIPESLKKLNWMR